MSQHFRASWHDYRSRCIYMITMTKASGAPLFGLLTGDHRIPVGQSGSSFVSATSVGSAIKKTLFNFAKIEPQARILQYALMPDHLHLLLFIEEPIADPLGSIIARFKAAVNQTAGISHVFNSGFNDQILKSTRSLPALFRYIRENPWRLAVRRARPDFFRRVNSITVGGLQCQAYGNLHLLQNPFREQVVVHRSDSPLQHEQQRQRWLYSAANGGVLVSPFISPAEKALRDEAEQLGARFILISDLPMGERYKPAAREFDLCTAGRLLIVSSPAAESTEVAAPLSRSRCLRMNALAATISAT